MKTVIYYHSLTGNSQVIADYLKNTIPSSVMEKVSEANVLDLETYDVFGLVIPTFHMNCSSHIEKFLHSLSGIKGRRFFLVQTYSVMPGKVLKKISELLINNGASLISSHRIAMPESYPPFRKKGITNSQFPTGEELKKFFDFTEDLSRKLSGQRQIEVKPISAIWDYLIPSPKTPKIKKDFGDLHVDKKKCTTCGICMENCLDSAIEMDEYPLFDISKCSNCFTCYNLCPRQAISTTKMEAGFSYSGPTEDIKGKLA